MFKWCWEPNIGEFEWTWLDFYKNELLEELWRSPILVPSKVYHEVHFDKAIFGQSQTLPCHALEIAGPFGIVNCQKWGKTPSHNTISLETSKNNYVITHNQ